MSLLRCCPDRNPGTRPQAPDQGPGRRLQNRRPRHEERVIIISSKDSDNSSRDAEKALQQMAALILKKDDSGTEAAKVGAGHVSANTIRLLIAGSQAGSLIGMSGQNIENLRNSSGATITILCSKSVAFVCVCP
ncbi:hypothetical protein C1H46_013215 [Malus baccata]|uniref:K Homology domain-containing protein n=1 Tax=Malus baccata TaxID=106549 RepID=A0A540MQZ1_MALBA|nr:hypothetical protein C1H46_013215 [Malus baccata]